MSLAEITIFTIIISAMGLIKILINITRIVFLIYTSLVLAEFIFFITYNLMNPHTKGFGQNDIKEMGMLFLVCLSLLAISHLIYKFLKRKFK